MATVITTSYTDDLDGRPLDRGDVRLVEWSWQGINYTLETSTNNLGEIESGTTPFSTVLAKSRRVRNGRLVAVFRPTIVPETASMAIRRWARQNGHQVSDRGRLSAVVLAAFAAVH